MSASYKTEGIVLKGINFGEADRILTIFTQRFGKIKAIAKGVRKIKSHLAGSLESFFLTDLQFHEGRTFYIVTGAVIREEFPALHTDLRKTARAFYLGELVDRFSEEKEKSEEAYNLFVSALKEVDEGIPGPQIQAFELKLIEASGFKPELFHCVHCKEKLKPGANFWDALEGGVICENCNRSFHHGQPISDESIKLLRFILNNDSTAISKLKVPENIELETDKILTKYIESILERKLKSKDFLEMV